MRLAIQPTFQDDQTSVDPNLPSRNPPVAGCCITDKAALVSSISSTDPDFRICAITFDQLLTVQRHAESNNWGTRWSSESALHGQVADDQVLLLPLLREERDGFVRAYRCLALFSMLDGDESGGLATIDVEPDFFNALPRLDRDLDVRTALTKVFSLASGSISMVTKP